MGIANDFHGRDAKGNRVILMLDHCNEDNNLAYKLIRIKHDEDTFVIETGSLRKPEMYDDYCNDHDCVMSSDDLDKQLLESYNSNEWDHRKLVTLEMLF